MARQAWATALEWSGRHPSREVTVAGMLTSARSIGGPGMSWQLARERVKAFVYAL